MLLLKYPPLASPQGPQTFVDDAIYLRDNFSAAGGAKIIDKYSGKTPMVLSSALSAFVAEGFDQKQRLFAARSRLQSPTRFLQQQGGVEALFQGAAKGVFDRGERLGINQAVRDAVGEVKKNMQGLQASRANSKTRRAPDAMRWSLDEGRSVPAANRFESAMKTRNKQLAHMLDDVMADLRQASVSKDGDKNDYIKAIDIAAAKVGFVKVYLEDSAMPLPPNPKHAAPEGPYPPIVGPASPSPALTPTLTAGQGASSIKDPGTKTIPTSESSQPPTPIPAALSGGPASKSSADAAPEPASKKTETESLDQPAAKRLAAPLPTRASIAQSNFSWMLEPDSTLASSPKSASLNSQSPFLKSGRRPNSGSTRDKTAFLFGDDGEEGKLSAPGMPAQNDSEEGFSLEPMRGSGDKE
jgi:TBC1 domain family protein 5